MQLSSWFISPLLSTLKQFRDFALNSLERIQRLRRKIETKPTSTPPRQQILFEERRDLLRAAAITLSQLALTDRGRDALGGVW